MIKKTEKRASAVKTGLPKKGARGEKGDKKEAIAKETKLERKSQEIVLSVEQAVSRINKFFGDDREQGEKDELREWVRGEKKRVAGGLSDSDVRYGQAIFDGGEGFDREKALLQAGFSVSDAKRVGVEIDGRVASYVQVLKMERDIEMNMTRVDILRLWGALAVDAEVKASDRLRASELIAKVKGMFVEHEMAKAPVVNLVSSDKLKRLASLAYEQWRGTTIEVGV